MPGAVWTERRAGPLRWKVGSVYTVGYLGTQNGNPSFINYPSLSAPDLPFGGIKRSGYGKELSNLGIEEFINKKLVCVADGPALVA
jgi:acyl-CoA reductase-like NAD-dependent aldehyde dehydrogenase